jgi:alkane 1-monooxygenase
MKAIGYTFALFPAALFWISLHASGAYSWLCVAVVFGVIPLLEWIIGAQKNVQTSEQLKLRAQNTSFDVILYLIVPIQWGLLIYYMHFMAQIPVYDWNLEHFGKVFGMGILCGSYGINVAHELGHRQTRMEQRMAQSLLLTSLYMHFFIEHNRGHHKHVATPEDPSTARKNEPVYAFWIRSMTQTWLKSWKLEFQRLQQQGKSKLHYSNQMLQFQAIQLGFLLVVYLVFGGNTLTAVVLSGIIGALLLETINYIEHYGLLRKKDENGYYERVQTQHSWNSDHLIGRLLLFELSRHSDHHYKTYKKYQELQSADDAPQMPTGYPGMMVLSLIFPLWFGLMNPKVTHFNS